MLWAHCQDGCFRDSAMLSAEKRVQDETCFLKRLGKSGGRGPIRHNSGTGLQKEQVALSLCLRKQLQPAASAASLFHTSPAGVLAPALFLWSQKETLH